MAPMAGLLVPTTVAEEEEEQLSSHSSEPEPLDEGVADLWASVPSHVVRDLPPSNNNSSHDNNNNTDNNSNTKNNKNTRGPSQPTVVETGGSGAGRRLVPDDDDDEENSSSDASFSSSSSSSQSSPAADDSVIAEQTLGQGFLDHSFEDLQLGADQDPLNLTDLFGGGVEESAADPLDSDLPSLEETRQRGKAIERKRQEIQNIASKYTASEAGDVLLQRQSGLEDRWRKKQQAALDQKQTPPVEQPQQNILLSLSPTNDQQQQSPPPPKEVIAKVEDLSFTPLGFPEEEAPNKESPQAEGEQDIDLTTRPNDELTSGVPAKYQVTAPEPEDIVSTSTSTLTPIVEILKTTKTTSATVPRPWDPLEGPLLGPKGTPPSREVGLSALRQLGRNFQSLGLQQPRESKASGPSDRDVAKLLDQRFGQDFPPCSTTSATPKRKAIPKDSSPPTYQGFQVGDEVLMQNLARADLNGKLGKVVRSSGPVPDGRVPVRIEDSSILVKAENLVKKPSDSLMLEADANASPPVAEPPAAEPSEQQAPTISTSPPGVDNSAPVAPVAPVASASASRYSGQADAAKLSIARELESKVAQELWAQCLPGNDLPVGDADFLPSPEAFR